MPSPSDQDTIQELQDQLTERDSRITALETEVTDLQSEVDSSASEEKTKELEASKKELETLKATTSSLEVRVRKLQILKDFPDLVEDDLKGSTEDEIKASAVTVSKRINTIVEKIMKANPRNSGFEKMPDGTPPGEHNEPPKEDDLLKQLDEAVKRGDADAALTLQIAIKNKQAGQPKK